MKCIAFVVALTFAVVPAFAAVILSEGFNNATTPDGWAVEVVNDPGADPTITYVTTSTHPAGFGPYEGDRFVRFNSFDCPNLASMRLKCTNAFSTVGYIWIKVSFAWTEDDQYPGADDFVSVQWSTNGTEWHSASTNTRYSAAGDSWTLKDVELPGNVVNVTNLQVAFVFNSRYGNDCHLDALEVHGEGANVYLTPETQNKQGLPESTLSFLVTVTNRTPVGASFNLTYGNTNWHESGPATTGFLPAGGSTSITVTAHVPEDAAPDNVNTAIVTAAQGGYMNTAEVVSRCVWTNTIFYEPFNSAASTNGWQTYRLAENVLGWTYSTASGNPAPSLRHGDVTVTTVVSNWIVIPAMDLRGYDQLTLSLEFITFVTAPRTYYYSGAFISTGSSNPASGDFVEVARASGALATLDLVTTDISAFRESPAAHLAFLYIGTNSHRQYVDNIRIVGAYTAVDNAQLSGPATLTVTCGQATVSVTGLLYRAGRTGGALPAPGYEVQIGYGVRGSAPDNSWTWFDAAHSGPFGNNDAYTAAIPVTRAGDMDMAVRIRKGTLGPWVHGDLDGSSNGYHSAQTIQLTSICPPPLGGLLYQQQLAPPGTVYFSSWRSPPSMDDLAADDFTVDSNVVVQTIRWTGFYAFGRNGSETGFWLRIFADDPEGGSHPGAVLYEAFHAGYACEFSTGVVEHYQADLSDLFIAEQGKTYWFSAQLQCTGEWGLVDSPAAVQGVAAMLSTNGGAQWDVNIDNRDTGFELYGKPEDSVGDGIPDWWRARYFGGDGTTTNDDSCATADPDKDGVPNDQEFAADTNPMDPSSRLAIRLIAKQGTNMEFVWTGGSNAWQYLEFAPSITSEQWSAIRTNVPPTAITNAEIHSGGASLEHLFYRIKAWR